jgi:hypothetical protein
VNALGNKQPSAGDLAIGQLLYCCGPVGHRFAAGWRRRRHRRHELVDAGADRLSSPPKARRGRNMLALGRAQRRSRAAPPWVRKSPQTQSP